LEKTRVAHLIGGQEGPERNHGEREGMWRKKKEMDERESTLSSIFLIRKNNYGIVPTENKDPGKPGEERRKSQGGAIVAGCFHQSPPP